MFENENLLVEPFSSLKKTLQFLTLKNSFYFQGWEERHLLTCLSFTDFSRFTEKKQTTFGELYNTLSKTTYQVLYGSK